MSDNPYDLNDATHNFAGERIRKKRADGWTNEARKDLARSNVTHEQEVSLTHDLPPKDAVKSLREHFDRPAPPAHDEKVLVT